MSFVLLIFVEVTFLDLSLWFQLNEISSEDPVILKPCLTFLGNLSTSLFGGLKTETQVLYIYS